MNKKTWDLYAPIYKRAMKADQKIYDFMYERIPEKVLSEIDRVLRPGGLLIAPNFVEHKGTFINRVWSRILRIAGVCFEHQWSAREYLDFLENNGWHVTFNKEMAARIALMYAECERGREQGV